MPSRSRLVPASMVVSLTLAATALGCSSSSRDMAAPAPDQTTVAHQPVSQDASTSSSAEQRPAFELISSDFVPGDVLPNRYTCRGMDEPPSLSWSNVPVGTQELALVMRDQTAGRVHWIVSGIDPGAGELPEGDLPDNVVEGRNGFGTAGWTGPCPAAGSGVHTYEFQIYALAEPSGLAAGLEAAEAVRRMETAARYGTASLLGTVGD